MEAKRKSSDEGQFGTRKLKKRASNDQQETDNLVRKSSDDRRLAKKRAGSQTRALPSDQRPYSANTEQLILRNPLGQHPKQKITIQTNSNANLLSRVSPLLQLGNFSKTAKADSSHATIGSTQKPSKGMPRNIIFDKEALYDSTLKLKQLSNNLMDENNKLKTKIQNYEEELNKKNKLLNGLIAQMSNLTRSPNVLKLQKETHLISALKQRVKKAETDMEAKDKEILTLKRDIKVTKFKEFETQIKELEQECVRLRQLLIDMRAMRQAEEREKVDNLGQLENMQELRNQNDELKQKLTNYEKKEEEWTAQLSKAKSRVQDVERQSQIMEESRIKIEQLKMQLDAAQAINKANEQNKFKGKEAKDLELDTLKAKIKEYSERLEDANVRLGEANSKLGDANYSLEETKSKLEETERELKKSEEAAKELDKQMKRKDDEVNQIKGTDQIHNSEHLKQKDTLSSNIIRLEEELESKSKQIEELIKTQTQLQAEIEENKKYIRKPPIKKRIIEEEELYYIKQLVRIKLIESRQSWDDFKNAIFRQYRDEEMISIKELIKVLSMQQCGLTPFEGEQLARYIVEPRDVTEVDYNQYEEITVQLAKQKLEDKLIALNYYVPSSHEELLAGAIRKLREKFSDFKSAIATRGYDAANFDLRQWNEIIQETVPEIDITERDMLISLAFAVNKDLRALSLTEVEKRVEEASQKSNVIIEEKPIANSEELDIEQKSSSIGEEKETKKETKDKDKRSLKIEQLDDVSIKIIILLTKHLNDNNIKLSDLLSGKIYSQTISIRRKQTVLEVVKSENLFSTLRTIGCLPYSEGSHEEEHENLMLFLCIEQMRYTSILRVKKLQNLIQHFATDPAMKIRAKEYFESLETGKNKREEVTEIPPEKPQEEEKVQTIEAGEKSIKEEPKEIKNDDEIAENIEPIASIKEEPMKSSNIVNNDVVDEKPAKTKETVEVIQPKTEEPNLDIEEIKKDTVEVTLEEPKEEKAEIVESPINDVVEPKEENTEPVPASEEPKEEKAHVVEPPTNEIVEEKKDYVAEQPIEDGAEKTEIPEPQAKETVEENKEIVEPPINEIVEEVKETVVEEKQENIESPPKEDAFALEEKKEIIQESSEKPKEDLVVEENKEQVQEYTEEKKEEYAPKEYTEEAPKEDVVKFETIEQINHADNAVKPLEEKVNEEIKEEVKDKIEEIVNEHVKEEVKEEIKEYVKDEVQEQIKEEVKENVEEIVNEHVKDEVQEQIKEEAKENVEEIVNEHIKEETKEQAKEEVKDEIKEEVKEEIKEQVNAFTPERTEHKDVTQRKLGEKFNFDEEFGAGSEKEIETPKADTKKESPAPEPRQENKAAVEEIQNFINESPVAEIKDSKRQEEEQISPNAVEEPIAQPEEKKSLVPIEPEKPSVHPEEKKSVANDQIEEFIIESIAKEEEKNYEAVIDFDAKPVQAQQEEQEQEEKQEIVKETNNDLGEKLVKGEIEEQVIASITPSEKKELQEIDKAFMQENKHEIASGKVSIGQEKVEEKVVKKATRSQKSSIKKSNIGQNEYEIEEIIGPAEDANDVPENDFLL